MKTRTNNDDNNNRIHVTSKMEVRARRTGVRPNIRQCMHNSTKRMLFQNLATELANGKNGLQGKITKNLQENRPTN